MAGKGKKIGIGILAVLIVVGGGIGIYAWYYASKHKAQYGKKGKITKKDANKVETFKKRVLECKKEVFGHKDLPYKPKKDSGKDGWKKATEALVKGLNTCLQGQRSADGKGWSGKMNPKYLDELLANKECKAFADSMMKFKKCQFLFEELPDHAGFDDGLGDDDDDDDDGDGGDAMKADAMKADGGDAMKADAMKADGGDAMKADGMDAMKADGMDAMKADGMDAMKTEGMKSDAMKAAMK